MRKARALAIFIMVMFLLVPFWLPRPLRAVATTSQLTGTLTDAQGNPLNGYIVAQLPVPAQYSPGSIAVTTSAIRCSVINGALQTCPPLYDVAALQPQNLWYTINAYNTAGQFVMGGNYSVTGTTFNLGAAVPTSITTSNVSYLNPVSLSANNVFTGNNTFSNPISISALGVAPLVVASNTLVPNLNAQIWDNVQMTNSPSAGQVPVALNSTTAQWGNPQNETVVYSTPSSPTAGAIGVTTMATPGVTATYRFSIYIDQTALGASCGGNPVASPVLTFTDPNTVSTSTTLSGIMQLTTNGTVGSNNVQSNYSVSGTGFPSWTFRAKGGTNIQYNVTFAPLTSCSPNPTIQAFPILEQLTTN